MKEQIKEKLNRAIEIILEHEGYYVDILNIDDVLDKVVNVFENVYKVVPYKHIFYPDIRFYICVFPFEEKSFSFVIDISAELVELFKVYKSNFLEENRLTVHIKFSPHFGKEYNPLALEFVPKDVKNLRVYPDASYFDIPLKVEVTKYDLV
jgi:predicted AlkP superfamily pyrophosphatase or phosphodiesterase